MKELLITLKNYRCFSDQHPASILVKDGFTAFVGKNNSGKSSLLKFFYEFKELFQILGNQQAFLSILNGSNQNINIRARDPDEVFCDLNNRDLTIQFEPRYDLDDNVRYPNFITKITASFSRGNYNSLKLHTELKSGDIQPGSHSVNPSRNLSTMKGVAPLGIILDFFNSLSKTLYIGPFRNAVNLGSQSDYYDISIGQSFIEQFKSYKSGGNKRQSQAIIDLTETIKRIFEFDDLQINTGLNDHTIQYIINRKSYLLHEVGSGISQFLLVLANAAIKNPSWILIDEPELNLHPTLQLDFLKSLASFSTRGIIFGTHSIGLAKEVGSPVYSIKKASTHASIVSELETTPNLSEFLGELSFSGYRENGFDKVLLVEGTTDVAAIHELLIKLGKHRSTLLLPLGGSSVINSTPASTLEEIKRISPNIFALIDSERNGPDEEIPSERKLFRERCFSAGINCHILELRSLENYFSNESIKKVCGDTYAALQPFQKLEGRISWGKSNNWRITRAMEIKDFFNSDLGQFLNSIE